MDLEIAHIPMDDIRVGVCLKNIRTVFNEQYISELADSIYTNGLISPLTVMESDDPVTGDVIIELVAGECRLRAIQSIVHGRDDTFMEDGIPCVTYVGTIKDARFVNASENLDRSSVDEVDTCKWVWDMLQEGITQTELAKKLHKSLPWVNFRALVHERACEDLKLALREGIISFSAAYLMSKNVDEDEQKSRVKKARTFNEKITVESARTAGDRDKTSRPSAKARQKMTAEAERVADEKGSEYARGVAMSLRWVDGLVSEEEMATTLDWEQNKVPPSV
jgi:ParB-like chromosome segregation protein Spo0J